MRVGLLLAFLVPAHALQLPLARLDTLVHRHHTPRPLLVSRPHVAGRTSCVAANSIPESETAPAVANAITAALVAIWYASSVICNQTTKDLLSLGIGGAAELTLLQLMIGACCGLLVWLGTRAPWDTHAIRSRAQLFDTALAAASITAGFGTLNACMGVMHVSLVMVLRAAEPLTTLLLSNLLLPSSEHASPQQAVALLPVVLGCMLAAVGKGGPSVAGLALATVSNVCFSLRGIVGKRVARTHRTKPFPLFFQMCWLDALMQCAVVLAGVAGGAPLPALPPLQIAPTLLLNGVSFYAYLQLSQVPNGL